MMKISICIIFLCAALVKTQDYDDSDTFHQPEPQSEDSQAVASSAPKFVKLQGKFPNEQFLKFQKGRNIRVLLDHGKWSAITRADGTFAIYDIPAGVHILHVHAIGWHFEPVRVEVTTKGRIKASIVGADSSSKRLLGPNNELRLEPTSRLKYFEEREKLDLMSYLRNPMTLIIIFMVGMTFLMPKVMENMPQEEMEKVREQMRTGGPTRAAVGDAGGNGGATGRFREVD